MARYLEQNDQLSYNPKRLGILGTLPIQCDGSQSEYTSNDSVIGYKVVNGAIDGTEMPVIVSHINEVKQSIENRHHQVSERQVHQEIVGGSPHSFMTCNAMHVI